MRQRQKKIFDLNDDDTSIDDVVDRLDQAGVGTKRKNGLREKLAGGRRIHGRAEQEQADKHIGRCYLARVVEHLLPFAHCWRTCAPDPLRQCCAVVAVGIEKCAEFLHLGVFGDSLHGRRSLTEVRQPLVSWRA